jgi:hypothetical protein
MGGFTGRNSRVRGGGAGVWMELAADDLTERTVAHVAKLRVEAYII